MVGIRCVACSNDFKPRQLKIFDIKSGNVNKSEKKIYFVSLKRLKERKREKERDIERQREGERERGGRENERQTKDR